MADADRRFDLVLFGATGFTGQLVAEYLTRRAAGTPLRWALAGRSRGRLEAIRAGLAAIDPAITVELVVADALDLAAMTELARDTTTVCTTVGPYARLGAPLVAACVAAGTAYCDLTGEVPFIRASIDRHHRAAQATGARIVHCCGFDSVPSELGVWLLQRALEERAGRGAASVTALFELRGQMSGGTVASLLGVVDAAARDRATRRLLGDPYGLDPVDGPRGHDRDRRGPGYDRTLGRFTAPFVMAAINTRVVRRSHALLGHPWGVAGRYDEAMGLPRSPVGAALAVGVTGALAGFVAASQVPRLRALLEARLPKPGDGPSAAARARGRYRVRVHGTVDGTTVTATVADDLDPGYDGTAKLLGEAALALALDPPCSDGGVLTPMVALAPTLAPRLRAAGVTLDVA
ncbi:MAG: saccharopine dehydrogenase NADP-binding domain-containing protein [Kofleriaceae bacterium]